MTRLRRNLILGALSISLIMSYLLRDVIYNIVVVPLAYLWFVAKFYYSVVPQIIFWILLLIVVFMIL